MIKILAVDHAREIRRSIKQTYEYLGFTVFAAATAARALDIFKKKKPKIVFLDSALPDADSIILLNELKAIDTDVIVIMLAGKERERDTRTQERFLEAGADDFLTKPFGTNDLRSMAMEKISSLLSKTGHMKKPCILIVDDEQQARTNLREFISPRYTCEIIEAGDGRTAIQQVAEKIPDIILLDIRMPGINGIEAIREIKALSPDSKVIIISAWKSPDIAAKALKAGAMTYLDKPIELKVFQERFESALVSICKRA